jgi:predicted acylesterase/phospholipase RssA
MDSGSTEPYGPFRGPEVGAPESNEAIEKPDAIVLVLGRGLAHGFAHVGVLRALRELKIPIHSIYATEVGALASALYFTQPNPNRIDWALLRFNEKNLGAKKGAFNFSLTSPEGELDKKLQEVFKNHRVEEVSDRLHITLTDVKSGDLVNVQKGPLWLALRGALAGTNEFDPIEFEGKKVKTSGMKLFDTYQLAQRNEKYPVVVVGVGAPPSELFRKTLELEKATLLYVPLPGIDDLDLKKRNQAVFAGKNKVQQAAKELLALIGRSSE